MKRLMYISFLFIALPSVAQFSPQYNSYMLNGLVINPAFTGTRECLSIVGVHSSQWVGFDGAPRSDFFSVHAPANNNHAVGLSIMNDNIGVQNQTGIFPSYAYHLKLSNTQKLSFGVNLGVNFFNIRNTEVKTNVADLAFQQNVKLRSLPNIGAGLYYYTKSFYSGLSSPALFTNELSAASVQEDLFKMNVKRTVFMLTSGGNINITRDLVWKPSFLFKAMLSNIFQLDLNCNIDYKDKLKAGLSYRHKDAIVGFIGFRFNPKFDLAYSYSYPLSNIVRVSSGSHEIVIRFELRKKVATFNPRYF